MPKTTCLLGSLLLLAAPLAAQVPTAEYGARRDSVAARLGSGVLLAYGAPEPMTDEADFHQLPAFEYLTGHRRPNAVFVMAMKDGKRDVPDALRAADRPAAGAVRRVRARLGRPAAPDRPGTSGSGPAARRDGGAGGSRHAVDGDRHAQPRLPNHRLAQRRAVLRAATLGGESRGDGARVPTRCWTH